MGRATETPLKSARRIRDIPQAVAPPDDLHEETHDSEFSEDSEEFSDYEDSDYENCVYCVLNSSNLYSQQLNVGF